MEILYKGKLYIERGDTFLYRVRLADMSDYVLLIHDEIDKNDMDLRQLKQYRKKIEKGKPFMSPYRLNPNRKGK